MSQNFKGDPTELKMQAVGDPLFDLTETALDEFYADGFDAAPFLLLMYDDGRMPFSERINRDAFVDFVRQALKNFPFTGIFEVYLSVLKSVFGQQTEIRFYIDTPGALTIEVMAVANTEFHFIGRNFLGGSNFETFNVTDSDGNQLVFRGVPGIDTEYELNLLFSELMPCGITPEIILSFVEISDWAIDGSDDIVDDDDNGIIFIEGGS